MMNNLHTLSRRGLLQFFGRLAGAGTALSLAPGLGMSVTGQDGAAVPHIQPTAKDALVLADGLAYRVLASWGQTINGRGEKFGFNNDFLAFLPFENHTDDGLLWVNHEDLVLGYFDTPSDPDHKSRQDVRLEMTEVGGSILRIRKAGRDWELVIDDHYNRRLDANTEISLVGTRPIHGRSSATGTFANCGGGVTPWRTVLTCEENYHFFTGEVALGPGRRKVIKKGLLGWERYLDLPPEHYGWVVEVDPFTGTANKLTAMGRFAHESASVVQARDGRCVVYSGDDKTDECIYKFIAAAPGSLVQGTLYVADTHNGRWLPLVLGADQRLDKLFTDQTDLLIRTREAARIVGGTPQDRPEDIEYDRNSGAVFIALTKNLRRARPFGSILKIVERDNDPLALEFTATTCLAGGSESGIACPDNLAFDPRGNLWVATDVSSFALNRFPYTGFANNGLFFVPMAGPHAGGVFQVAAAPVASELAGMTFTADGRTLFLSVQHPGENSKDVEHLTSHWPDGGNARPRPGVVTITGAFLDRYSSV
jgi:secreted PhoX family phosphatase